LELEGEWIVKALKKIFKWAGNVALILLVALAILSVFSFIKSKSTENYIPGIGNYKFLAVLSGSMSPAFNTYDMIIDRQINIENLKKGDVITSWIGDSLVTHRITQVIKKDNNLSFKTKGDANNVEDENEILAKDIVGIYVFHIPYMGLIMSKIRGPLGIGIVWTVFAFIAFNEIFSEIIKSKKNKKVSLNKNLKEDETEEINPFMEDNAPCKHSIGNPNSGYISE
jgi:signal peptidase I